MAVSHVPSSPLVEANIPFVNELWGISRSKMMKFSYEWTIEDFSFRGEELGEYIYSPEFSTGAKDDFKWRLQIQPRGKDEKTRDSINLYLYLLSKPCDKSNVMCKFKFSIVNSNGEETNTFEASEAHNFKNSTDWGYPTFIKRDFLLKNANNLLPKDTLTILCEASILTDTVNISGHGKSARVKPNVQDCKLSEDFGNLFIDGKFSDVTLVVGEHEFQAHKLILAARSEVFAAMFEHNMEELRSNRVVITDVDHEVLEEMLRFIYSGKGANLQKFAKNLFAAADKYALENLKVMCEEALYAELSIETAAETLVLAHLHSSDKLKARTIDFIKTCVTDVVNSKEWQKMLAGSTYLSLLSEVIQATATHN